MNRILTNLRGRIKRDAGETLVEVMASIFLFLILMAILQGAITYCSNSLQKNKEIRSENAEIIEGLQTAEEKVATSSYEMRFVATNTDMTVKGNQVFAVSVDLAKKAVDYQDSKGASKQVSFSLFESSEDTSVGGDNP